MSALAGGLLVIPATVGSVLAASAIDQSYTANDTFDFVSRTLIAAQTYTAGKTGVITAVDLGLQRVDTAGTLNVSIQATSGGVPTGVPLTSATVASAAVADDGFTHLINVALSPVAQTAGTLYAIVLAAPSASVDTEWLWARDTVNGYADGAALMGNSVTNVWTVRDARDDHTFTTWVATPCLPGYWSTTGFETCTAADPGNYVADAGATSQTECALGTWQDLAGQTSCNAAAVGFYVDQTGATSQTACPDGTTTDGTGSTSASACHSVAPPPTITCSANPSVLWPPNNKLVNISVVVTSNTDFRLVSVTANEGTAADMDGWTLGSADVAGQLRASRNGGGSGRTYSLTYEATNAVGDTAQCTATVSVPHDQEK